MTAAGARGQEKIATTTLLVARGSGVSRLWVKDTTESTFCYVWAVATAWKIKLHGVIHVLLRTHGRDEAPVVMLVMHKAQKMKRDELTTR